MPSSQASRAAHAYADRLCARIPEALAAIAAAKGLKPSHWCRDAGCSRDMMWRTFQGESIPTLHFVARISYSSALTLVEFAQLVEPT